jgi:hypothetical protein
MKSGSFMDKVADDDEAQAGEKQRTRRSMPLGVADREASSSSLAQGEVIYHPATFFAATCLLSLVSVHPKAMQARGFTG